MDKLFLTILNMSLTGAFVIAVICVARRPLKKAPKIISYRLWAVAGFRLVFPFSVESVYSLLPFKAAPIPTDIALQPLPRIDSGIPFINDIVVLPAAAPDASANPLQIWTAIGAWIWIIGVAVMLAYSVISFVILKRKMNKAALTEENIYEAQNITSPFVLGVFKPKIYLPVGLSAREIGYIVPHEKTHIRRHDHIVKLAAYFILCLHWFNPLAWAAFLLMGVDMEMSCDEYVLNELGGEAKKDYSLSLLALATERRFIGGSPLAFGESGVKERINNVLNFKKPSRVIIAVAIILATLLTIGFALNRAEKDTAVPALSIIGSWETAVYVDGMLLPLRVQLDEDFDISFELTVLMEYLNYSVIWHSQELEMVNEENTIHMITGENKCVINGTEIVFDKPVYADEIADGVFNLYLPQSFLPAVLGLEIVSIERADDGSNRINYVYIASEIVSPPERDTLILHYPSSFDININGTATILTNLDELISFYTRLNDRSGQITTAHTRESMSNDILYICELSIYNLLRLNDDKDGNISHPELESDEKLSHFFRIGTITAVTSFDVLQFDDTEERITVVAYVVFDNDRSEIIAFNYHVEPGYSLLNIYLP